MMKKIYLKYWLSDLYPHRCKWSLFQPIDPSVPKSCIFTQLLASIVLNQSSSWIKLFSISRCLFYLVFIILIVVVFQMSNPRHIFRLFSFVSNNLHLQIKTVHFSGIRTRVGEVEDKQAEHLTTTMTQTSSLSTITM